MWRNGAGWWSVGRRQRSWRRWCTGRTWPLGRWERWPWRRCGLPPCTPADRAGRRLCRRAETTSNPTAEPGKEKWPGSRLGMDKMGGVLNNWLTGYVQIRSMNNETKPNPNLLSFIYPGKIYINTVLCINTWNYPTIFSRVPDLPMILLDFLQPSLHHLNPLCLLHCSFLERIVWCLLN